MKNDGSSNKAYSGKGIINRFISAVLPSDMLISYKMAVPKMKENFLMIFTIIMLTVFTYCSEDLMDEIGRNNEIYYKNIYTDDVLIQDEQSHYYSKLDNLCKKIQKQVDTNVFLQSEIIGETVFLFGWNIFCIIEKYAEIRACEKQYIRFCTFNIDKQESG